jgi:two-component system cell cycle sensor histidine kinase/response regulator CckA
MAIDLLNEEARSRSKQMNSCTAFEGVIQSTESETLAAFALAGRWCGPETILLVEDEWFVRKATAEVLESAGYRLVLAKNATEALEACRTCVRPVDLLLTDVIMPGMSGRDLAAEFASLCPRARVLLMSGHQQQLAACERSHDGRKCMAKPFSISTLLNRVRVALDTNPFESGAQA